MTKRTGTTHMNLDCLTKRDTETLQYVQRRAYQLDFALFNVCGIHFGWGSVIGIIPIIGDTADAILALLLVWKCGDIDEGLPRARRMKMVMNVIFDFTVGLIPLIGDLGDAAFKCNARNVASLEQYLCERISDRQERFHLDSC
ncbi:hypothetical protein N7539_008697 [Penicillium diatomitis]|uniref:DUF4112 domain-containing protein n=1 Tax=Penicillium diatomitis TaxID=2819901 RepID=A0A9X0BM79_9EURO|nr:uncharacterized protein N7539_008611 [Penicillium diatomitis]XP_056786674.1 uncharacterized protein N7539_008697 [Penicillium diatomitis]KAJ5472042.1 hypothetical protein N7539_008611 [Penicillium diatomitis]KAJ5472128.1 hypothetical protein N7539_008697 [Penicillium diatomitis]